MINLIRIDVVRKKMLVVEATDVHYRWRCSNDSSSVELTEEQ